MIDLRSDTVTRPTPRMREAMAHAEVGDDVFGEDPTVCTLEERVAALLGKERALFVPSGTMGNQLAIKCHTEAGDEVIVEAQSHIFHYETTAPALISSVQLYTIPSEHGALSAEDIREAIRDDAYYMPRTRLVCLENTHNRAGGRILPIEKIKDVSREARSRGLSLHLDGARLWNASVATGISLKEYGSYFYSVSICFSKGLGCPVGSVLVGNATFIEKARRFRKILGGGMRQAGILAAAALYALDNNIDRMKEDHDNAQAFVKALGAGHTFIVNASDVETNIILVDVSRSRGSVETILAELRKRGVAMTPGAPGKIRAITHLDVSHGDVTRAAEIVRDVAQTFS